MPSCHPLVPAFSASSFFPFQQSAPMPVAPQSPSIRTVVRKGKYATHEWTWWGSRVGQVQHWRERWANLAILIKGFLVIHVFCILTIPMASRFLVMTTFKLFHLQHGFGITMAHMHITECFMNGIVGNILHSPFMQLPSQYQAVTILFFGHSTIHGVALSLFYPSICHVLPYRSYFLPLYAVFAFEHPSKTSHARELYITSKW